jgi:pilus assembly protein CpaB
VNKKVVGVGVAVAMALIGTVVLVAFVRGAEDRALEGEELVSVLVSDQQIPAGTPVDDIENMVSSEQVPEKIAPENTISDLVQVQGQVAAVDIVAGETLVATRFVAADDFSARPSVVEVPDGFLEVSIAMSQEQFVGGVPTPGDKVALIANGRRVDFIPNDPLAGEAAPVTAEDTGLTVTKIILQQALVTNVQGNPLPAEPTQSATERTAPAEGSLLVTLALDGPNTERLLYVRDAQSLNANLHMAVHNGDAEVTSQGISVENIINPDNPVG